MQPLAHHAGEQALAPLLLLTGGGFALALAIGRAWVDDARAWLARRVRGPEQRPHDGRR
jgi:hypothetical protein